MKTISKGIPVPEVMKGPRSVNGETASRMAVGDSILTETYKEAKAFRDCLKYHGFNAVIRQRYPEIHGEEGHRVWKVTKERKEDDLPSTSEGKDPLCRGSNGGGRAARPHAVKQSGEGSSSKGDEKGNSGVGKGARLIQPRRIV